MPHKETTKTKKWGQADRDLLADLTNRQLINITDTSPQNIDQVRDLHFRLREKKNFHRNFRDDSAAWDLEIEYSGTRRKSAAAAAKPPPPVATAAAATATSFSVDASDPLTTHYYASGVYDYADVLFCVNGTMKKGEYQIQVAEDGLSVSFVRAIPSRSFDKKILKKIIGEDYRESNARVVAWDDTALEMQRQNVRPLNGLFWGERQVVRLQ
jgi:hypothetical protein